MNGRQILEYINSLSLDRYLICSRMAAPNHRCRLLYTICGGLPPMPCRHRRCIGVNHGRKRNGTGHLHFGAFSLSQVSI